MTPEKMKLAFVFWAPGADPKKHRAVISLDTMDFHVVAVPDYDQAVEISRNLVKQGVSAIELCGGFGNLGIAKVAEAVKGTLVGAVKFDSCPPLGGKSGDQFFGLCP